MTLVSDTERDLGASDEPIDEEPDYKVDPETAMHIVEGAFYRIAADLRTGRIGVAQAAELGQQAVDMALRLAARIEK